MCVFRMFSAFQSNRTVYIMKPPSSFGCIPFYLVLCYSTSLLLLLPPLEVLLSTTTEDILIRNTVRPALCVNVTTVTESALSISLTVTLYVFLMETSIMSILFCDIPSITLYLVIVPKRGTMSVQTGIILAVKRWSYFVYETMLGKYSSNKSNALARLNSPLGLPT